MALIGELTIYWLVAVVMVACTIGIATWVRTFPAAYRRSLLPVPAITGVLIFSYGAMAMEILTVPDAEGNPVTTARFLGYFFTFPVVVLYLGWLTDAERRHTLLASGLVIVFTLAVLVNWFVEGAIAAVPPLLMVGALGGILLILFRPMTRSAEGVAVERKLVFSKVRNLLALIWIMYLIVGFSSRQGLGLLDQFTGVFLGAYLDVIAHVGFAMLFLRADDAIERLHRDAPSFLTYLRE